MASGAGIIRERFLDLVDSLRRVVRRFRIAGKNGWLLVSLDRETSNLLTKSAESVQMTPEEAAGHWLGIQANAYQQDKEVERLWRC